MTSIVTRPEKRELLRLISSGACGSLTEDEIEKFKRCLSVTAQLWSGYVDGKLLCVLGLAPPSLCSDQAYLWLHTTEAMKEHVFTFVRHSQLVIEEMLTIYPKIVGQSEVGADKSIRWLKWLGAEFGEPDGHLVPFVIRAKERFGD